MATYEPRVQYRDWRGRCDADDLDFAGIRKLLRERELISDEDFVIGFRVWSGENHAHLPLENITLRALVVEADDYAGAEAALDVSDPVPSAREVDAEVTPEEFFMLFKRLSLVFGWQKLDVVGREFDGVPA